MRARVALAGESPLTVGHVPIERSIAATRHRSSATSAEERRPVPMASAHPLEAFQDKGAAGATTFTNAG